MIEGIDEISPNRKKSNLNVKKHRAHQKKTSKETSERRKKEQIITKDADIIFGLDNGATRNCCFYSSVS